MIFALLLSLWGCGGEDPSSIEPLERSEAGKPFAFAYAVGSATELELPNSSRAQGEEAPKRMPILGPFKLIRTVKKVQTWEAQLPVRPRNLFFSRAPGDMAVYSKTEEKPWRFVHGKKGPKHSWDFTAETILLRTGSGMGAPENGALELVYSRATTRDKALNLVESGKSKAEFVSRSIQLGEDTRHGLFLPAPSRAAWTVEIPASGVLDMEAVVLPPEARTEHRSSGAGLRLEWEVDGKVEVLSSTPLEESQWQRIKVDLSAYSGQTGTIRFVTEAGADALMDYVFLAEPTLYTPVKDPQRILLVFIDTLRPDHMGIYGYHRDTTPKLNAWSSDAAVFENARSVAPWTLPAARAAFSGHQPEAWGSVPRLSELFAQAGWVTGAFVGNIYLSANFDMSPGWETYNVVNWPLASKQAAKVRKYLDRHADRDALVMIHLMDMHLPYTEPDKYKNLWAGKAPAGLRSGSTRKPILKAYGKDRKAVRDWVVGRYDQNMRYLDDVLSELFEDVGEESPVVIFSDHGEEFWEHKEFEHGHSLYDEVLRVPFVVKAPGISGVRVEQPVSLLDLTPTTLELAGLPAVETVGRSVLPLLKGDVEAVSFFEDRIHAFGRPLYGQERWGSLDGDIKWTSHRGQEEVYDLEKDREEKTNLRSSVDLKERRASFEQGIGRKGGLVWRLDFGWAPKKPQEKLVVEIGLPRGFETAWLGLDPLKRSSMKLEKISDSRYSLTFKKGTQGSREVFFAPIGDVEDYANLSVRVVEGGDLVTLEVPPALVGTLPVDGTTKSFIRGRLGTRPVKVTFATSPHPASMEEIQKLETDEEVSEALKALGYTE